MEDNKKKKRVYPAYLDRMARQARLLSYASLAMSVCSLILAIVRLLQLQ